MSKKVKDYTLLSLLGSGSFGNVYKATKEGTDQIFAAKQIAKQKIKRAQDLENIEREIAILQAVKHPNIVAMYPVIQTENNLYLFMEYCKDGDLQGLLKPYANKGLEEDKALYYLKQIMSAMKELQYRRVIHRDIKPANILFDGQTLKLADFGYAKIAEQTSTRVGTPNYMAPEILYDNPNGHKFDAKVDLFSIGAVFYEMLFGKILFSGNTLEMIRGTMKTILASGYLDTSNLQGISEVSKDLLRKLLAYDPANRMSWDEVFNHPVFSETTGLMMSEDQEGGSHSNDQNSMMLETPQLQKTEAVSTLSTPASLASARLIPANLRVPRELEQLYIASKMAHEDKVCKFWLKTAREGVLFLKDASGLLATGSPYLIEISATISYISALCLLNARVLHIEPMKLCLFDQRPEIRGLLAKDSSMLKTANDNFKLTLNNIFSTQMDSNKILVETGQRLQQTGDHLSKIHPETISPEQQRELLSQVGSTLLRPSVTRALELFLQLRPQLGELAGKLEQYFSNLRYCIEHALYREAKCPKTTGSMGFLKVEIPRDSFLEFEPTLIFDWAAFEAQIVSEKGGNLKVLESLLTIN